MQSAAIDIRRFIDERPVGRYQLLIAGLCAAIVFVDGFDAQVMGFVAPALSAQLHIPRVTLGTVISSGTVGMMLGALTFGPLADRFGRRPVLILCALTFAAGSLLTARAVSVGELTAFRALTGIGLGGVMPNAIALTSEYMPKRSRNAAVMTMFCGFSLGSACAGWVAAGLIGRFGWPAVFLVGGSIPIVLALLSLAVLPESIRFLVRTGGQEQRIRGYLSRIAPGTPMPEELVAGEDAHAAGGSFPVAQLFEGPRARVTLLIWTMFFMNLLNLWLLNNWLPTIMHDAGISIETASVVTSLFQIGGLVGALLLAWISRQPDRLSFGTLAAVCFSAALFIVLIGEAGAWLPLLTAAVFAAGMGVIGAQIASNALAADFYPTAIRATGVGWALGIGRVGSILGPILGGVLLSYGGDARGVFWAASLPAVAAAGAALAAHVAIRTRP